MKLFFYPDYTVKYPFQGLLYSKFAPSSVSTLNIEGVIEYQHQNPSEQVVFHLYGQDECMEHAENVHEYRLFSAHFIEMVEYFKSLGGKVIWTLDSIPPSFDKSRNAKLEYFQRLAEVSDLLLFSNNNSLQKIGLESTEINTKLSTIGSGNYINYYQSELTREQARNELGIHCENRVFGYVGELCESSTLDTFIKAAIAITKKKEVSTLIAGFSANSKNNASEAIKHKCAPFANIDVFEEAQLVESSQRYFKSADFIVLPAHSSFDSHFLALAASFGKPVVVADKSVDERLSDLEFVFTYAEQDANALINLLIELNGISNRRLKELSNAAYAFACSLNWADVSASLVSQVEGLFDKESVQFIAEYEGAKHPVSLFGNQRLLEPDEFAVCIVNYFCSAEIKESVASLKRYAKRKFRLFIIDNSCSDNELNKLLAYFSNAVIVRPAVNLGYGAGANILLNLVKNKGGSKAAVFQPDVRFCEDVFSNMARAIHKAPQALHVLAAQKAPGDACEVYDLASVGAAQEPSEEALLSGLPWGEYSPNILSNRAIFLHLDILEKYSYLPEEYFLYCELTDWVMAIKRFGGQLLVHSDSKVFFNRYKGKRELPRLTDMYFLLRDSILFAKKHGFDVDEAKSIYSNQLVLPWTQVVQEHSPEFLNCFSATCKAAFEHAKRGLTGNFDVLSEIYKFSESAGESEGYIENISATDINGWAVADKANPNKPTELVYLVNQTFKGAIYPQIERADIEALGFNKLSGFRYGVDTSDINNDIQILDSKTLKPLYLTDAFKVARDKRRGHRVFNAPSSPKLVGHLDEIRNGKLSGWAIDENNPSTPVSGLELLINDQLVTTFSASLYREDLEAAGMGKGKCAFSILIPPEFLFGSNVRVNLNLAHTGQKLVERELAVIQDSLGYDCHTNLSDFLNWSYEHIMSPYGAYEQSNQLQRELAFVKRALVESASKVMSERQNFISIIMPAYNRAEQIETALESVNSQSYRSFELIVIDDGSIDNTCQVVTSYRAKHPEMKIELIKAPFNVGVSAARNLGLDIAKGEVVTYLDTDNEWDADYLLLVNAAYAQNTYVDCAYAGQEIWFNDPRQNINFRTGIRMAPFNHSKLENNNFIDLNIFSHRKSLYDQYGGFKEDIRRMVDWELILRYTAEKPPKLIPALMNKYYLGMATNQITFTESYSESLEKILQGYT